jgi:hypothetical protein
MGNVYHVDTPRGLLQGVNRFDVEEREIAAAVFSWLVVVQIERTPLTVLGADLRLS